MLAGRGGGRACPRMNVDNSRLSQITTRWNVIFEACHGPDHADQAAQAQVLERYCGAIYRYAVAACWATLTWPMKPARNSPIGSFAAISATPIRPRGVFETTRRRQSSICSASSTATE